MAKIYDFTNHEENPFVTFESLKIYQQGIKHVAEEHKTGIEALDQRITALETKLASSISAGETAPAEPAKNTIWLDTSTKTVKVYDGSQWISFGAVYQ